MGAQNLELFARIEPLREAVNNVMYEKLSHGFTGNHDESLSGEEIALYHARVLIDAIRCLGHNLTSPRELADAIVWIAKGIVEEAQTEAFSFTQCCICANNVEPDLLPDLDEEERQLQNIVNLGVEPAALAGLLIKQHRGVFVEGFGQDGVARLLKKATEMEWLAKEANPLYIHAC